MVEVRTTFILWTPQTVALARQNEIDSFLLLGEVTSTIKFVRYIALGCAKVGGQDCELAVKSEFQEHCAVVVQHVSYMHL